MCGSFTTFFHSTWEKYINREEKKYNWNTIKNIWDLYTENNTTIWAMTACRQLKYRLLVVLSISIPRRNLFSLFLALHSFIQVVVVVVVAKILRQSLAHSVYPLKRIQFLASIAFVCSISASAELFSLPFAALCRNVWMPMKTIGVLKGGATKKKENENGNEKKSTSVEAICHFA